MWNDTLKLNYPIILTKQSAPDTWSFLELREQQEVETLKKLFNSGYPLLSEQNSKWNIELQSELHMSSDSSIFSTYKENESVNFPLIEGKTISQYINDGPMQYEVHPDLLKNKWLNREKKRVIARLNTITNLSTEDIIRSYWGNERYFNEFLRGPESFYRLSFREVSSSTNRRTLISNILPPNHTSGNTLIIINPMKVEIECEEPKYEYFLPLKHQLFILGIFNSFVIDFIVRRKVSTHVNMFHAYQLPVPRFGHGDKFFSEIYTRSAHLVCISPVYDKLAKSIGMSGYQEGVTDVELRQKLQNQIDAYVAKIYRLTREELIYILSTFESPMHKGEMRKIGQGVIEEFDELQKVGELSWPI